MPARTITTPGFWDLHLHGVAGIDFMRASQAEMAFACERLGELGTAAFAPTLLTAEPKLLREACARWGRFLQRVESPRFLPPGAALPIGLHLEGPFLNPMMAGAHPKAFLKRPSLQLAGDFVAAADGHVAIVTIAPELPGAPALIRSLSRRRIRVQLGHSLATAREALAAAKAGASGLTHLYNAMRIHHREPGLLAPLTEGLVTAEIITDGIHLDPAFVAWLAAAAPGRLYAVSDGCSAIGARKGATLTLGSLVLRKEGRAAVVASNGVLAGGATALTEHPALLCKGGVHQGAPARLLALYHELQRKAFPAAARRVRAKNHFHPRSLRFLGSEQP